MHGRKCALRLESSHKVDIRVPNQRSLACSTEQRLSAARKALRARDDLTASAQADHSASQRACSCILAGQQQGTCSPCVASLTLDSLGSYGGGTGPPRYRVHRHEPQPFGPLRTLQHAVPDLQLPTDYLIQVHFFDSYWSEGWDRLQVRTAQNRSCTASASVRALHDATRG